MSFTIKQKVTTTVDVRVVPGSRVQFSDLPRGAIYHFPPAPGRNLRRLYIALGKDRCMELLVDVTRTLSDSGPIPEETVVYLGMWPGALPE